MKPPFSRNANKTRLRNTTVGLDSSVGIATRYGLDGSGIECRWVHFPHQSKPALGPTQPPIKWVPSLFPRRKGPVRGVNHPPPSRAEVKERVELFLYSPSGPSQSVKGRTLLNTTSAELKYTRLRGARTHTHTHTQKYVILIAFR